VIALLLISLAAIAKAFADTLDDHFDDSIFRNLSRGWWDANAVRKTAKVIFSYPVDAWHIGNSIMIISFIVAAVIHKPVFAWYYEIPIAGTVFNILFGIFYNKIFRR
jgi:hypothetical protein